MNHPHDIMGTVPERLDASIIRRLSVISPSRAMSAIAVEWFILAATIAIGTHVDAVPVTVLSIVIIGARQHALTVIAHDAAHFRLLRNRQLNDWVGNLLLAWPVFISVQGFRHYHGDHHRFLNREGDGNRKLWGTHDVSGNQTWEWRYPKTLSQFALKLARRVFLLTGVYWLVRGLIGGFMFGVSPLGHLVRILSWSIVARLLTTFGAWPEFLLYWVVPYCTWHVAAQYVRLTCEHSGIEAGDPRYADTRSTIPGCVARFFILPLNIGYHIEHHWYPSVPFYRLPELHATLAQQPGFRAHAHVEHSIIDSLRKCLGKRE